MEAVKSGAENFSCQDLVEAKHSVSALRFFLFFIFAGALAGPFASFFLVKEILGEMSLPVLSMVIFGGLTVGATSGLLVGLLSDVIFHGELEEAACPYGE